MTFSIIGSDLKSIYEGENEYKFVTTDGFNVYIRADSFEEAKAKYRDWSGSC